MIYSIILIVLLLGYTAWEYHQGVKEYGSWLWFFENDKTPDVKS
jgi:hypothetical protein